MLKFKMIKDICLNRNIQKASNTEVWIDLLVSEDYCYEHSTFEILFIIEFYYKIVAGGRDWGKSIFF